jgi:RND family efflux transporter MFP subunit
MSQQKNAKKYSKWLSKMMTVFAAAAVIAACQPPSQQPEETQVQESYGAAMVKAYKVSRKRISDQLTYTGTIEPLHKMIITPEVGGKIAKIHVEEGVHVREGQLLAELDTRSIKLQLEQAQAALEVAKANANDAEKNLKRMERLREENAISEQQLEKVTLAYESAQAQLKQAQASVNLAQHNLDVSIMRAPFPGIVASKNAEEGDVINPMMGGFSPNSGVLTLMDFSKVKVEIEVSQEDVVLIQKGQPAVLSVSAYPGRTFEGRVSVVNLAADPMSKKFSVEIQADNPGYLLRPNTFGKINLEISSREDVIAVPQRAILDDNHVFVVKGNKVERRDIEIGLESEKMVEIISGLSEDELVVVEGNYGLEAGAQVEVTEVIQ